MLGFLLKPSLARGNKRNLRGGKHAVAENQKQNK
jgi:hypothetical protein